MTHSSRSRSRSSRPLAPSARSPDGKPISEGTDAELSSFALSFNVDNAQTAKILSCLPAYSRDSELPASLQRRF